MKPIHLHLEVDCCCGSNKTHRSRSSIITILIDSLDKDTGEKHGLEVHPAPNEDTMPVLTIDAKETDLDSTHIDRNYIYTHLNPYTHANLDSCNYFNVSKMNTGERSGNLSARTVPDVACRTESQKQTLSSVEPDDVQLSQAVQETACQSIKSTHPSDADIAIRMDHGAHVAMYRTLDAQCQTHSWVSASQGSHADEHCDLSGDPCNKDHGYTDVFTRPDTKDASSASPDIQPRPVSRKAQDGVGESIVGDDDAQNPDRNSLQRDEFCEHPDYLIPVVGHCDSSNDKITPEKDRLALKFSRCIRRELTAEKPTTHEEQETNPKLATRHSRSSSEDTAYSTEDTSLSTEDSAGDLDMGIVSCNLQSVDIYDQRDEGCRVSEDGCQLDIRPDDRDADEESLSLELRLHSSDIRPQTVGPRSDPMTSQMATPGENTDERWNKIMRLYDLVEAQLYKYPWIVGCMISNEVLEIVSNLSTQVEREAAYDKLCEAVPQDLRQYLLFAEEGPSLLVGTSDNNTDERCRDER